MDSTGGALGWTSRGRVRIGSELGGALGWTFQWKVIIRSEWMGTRFDLPRDGNNWTRAGGHSAGTQAKGNREEASVPKGKREETGERRQEEDEQDKEKTDEDEQRMLHSRKTPKRKSIVYKPDQMAETHNKTTTQFSCVLAYIPTYLPAYLSTICRWVWACFGHCFGKFIRCVGRNFGHASTTCLVCFVHVVVILLAMIWRFSRP